MGYCQRRGSRVAETEEGPEDARELGQCGVGQGLGRERPNMYSEPQDSPREGCAARARASEAGPGGAWTLNGSHRKPKNGTFCVVERQR